MRAISLLRRCCVRASVYSLLLFTLITFSLVTAPVAGADVYWSLTSSAGDWSATFNWSSGILPTTSDNAWVTNGGTASVTSSAVVCDTLFLTAATATLSGSGQLGAFYEYVGSSGTGLLSQSGGTNKLQSTVRYDPFGDGTLYGGGLYLGRTGGSSGTYCLSGSGQLSAFEYVGFSGTGTFIQSGGTNTIGSSGFRCKTREAHISS